jgi:hypothetical protein
MVAIATVVAINPSYEFLIMVFSGVFSGTGVYVLAAGSWFRLRGRTGVLG